MEDYNELATIFIYKKNKKIKVLNLVSAQFKHNNLIKEGWKHIAYLNACIWITRLLKAKNPMEMISELKQR